MTDSSSSLELTTNKRHQQRSSFGMLSVNLLERDISGSDQSDEDCDKEVDQSRRVDLKQHGEEEELEEEEENINGGVDQRESNVEDEDEDDDDDEGDGIQVVGRTRDHNNSNINLVESNSFDSSAHDDYLSNRRQEEVGINQIILPVTTAIAATSVSISNSTPAPISVKVAKDPSRNSSHLMQSHNNQQNLHHCQRQHQHQHQQHQHQHHYQHQHQHKHKPLHSNGNKEFDEVRQVELFGISIVALIINGKERLCLAQISNTLLKEFSYNEIHNRRVALGITCIQCTPIQLEMLRRAGAMPSSSRRCGMITMREAERLCRSFLVEEQPPELPENFYFTVAHRVNYGCKGRFVPARYISSRAKCIECFYCGEYYSPNKFIFHSHRQPHATDCNPPDSPNINSWRKHIDLDWTQEHSQDIKYAWEDVKSLFNGGTRRRAPNHANIQSTPSTGNASNAGSSCASSFGKQHHQQRKNQKQSTEDEQLIVDVECDDSSNNNNNIDNKNIALNDLSDFKSESSINGGSGKRSSSKATIWPLNGSRFGSNQGNKPNQQSNSLMFSKPTSINNQVSKPNPANGSTILSSKRFHNSNNPQSNQVNKRFAATNNMIQQQHPVQIEQDNQPQSNSRLISNEQNVRFQTQNHPIRTHSIVPSPIHGPQTQQQHTSCQSNLPFNSDNFLNQSNSSPPLASTTNVLSRHQHQMNSINEAQSNAARKTALGLINPMSTTSNFIYSQLYSQLIQPQTQTQSQLQHQAANQQQHSAALDAQIALRHHIWSSLLANLQCNANNQTYSPQQNKLNHCTNTQQLIPSEAGDSIPSSTNLNHLFSNQMYTQQSQPQHTNQISNKIQTEPNLVDSPYKANQNLPFSLHKSFSTGETNDI